MNRDRLKNILQNNYSRASWINTLQFLSGNKNLLTVSLKPQQIILNTKKAQEIVRNLYQLGTLKTTDGITLPIFEIELQENIKIEYNKVGVNQLIKKHILKDAGKGAIATYFYESKKPKEWRFSFISKFGGSEFFDEVEDVETNPKKYTYIFGTPEEHRTALERLYNLEQSRFRLEDFFEAFNVEPVSNNFFKEYKNFYFDFVSHLSSNEQCRAVFEAENTEDVEKDIRNFVKRLLGRIVFLYFLQKKHWLGATDVEFDKEGKPIKYEGGDTNFLFNLFEADKEQFYTNWLSKLFFKALNTPDRKNDSFDLPEQYFINRSLKESDFLKPKNNQLAIPFLNGGLFEEYQEPKSHKTLKFPGFLFEELFVFFNGYNFTIYENSPEDHTVAVDPEMLGSIFENLLEDNKDKGAFYTPKEIVHFMTQESLIEYLNTHLNHLSKEQLENLVKNQVMDNIENADLIRIEKLIENVKVCDPAIGSGAFPMGLLQEIFSLKAFIHFALDRPQRDWQPADIKQNIIQNSIYGVDLEEDAVDIARLRFWLSLVVDEEKPKPLPNLDYKIMQGNSLLESFEGIPLNNTNLFNTPSDRNITLFEEPKEDYGIGDDIKKLMGDYFNPKNYRKKQAIHKAIDKKVIDFIDKCLEGFENQKLIELAGAKQSLKRKLELQQKTELILKEIKQIEDTLKSKGNARKKLLEFEEKSERPYFLWRLFFKDVFEDGGFDIVIANPPYVDIKNLNKDYVNVLFDTYETTQNRINLYSIFVELGTTLLNNKGVISYIIPNSILMNSSYKKIRKLILDKLDFIIKLPDNIFSNAIVETIIFQASNNIEQRKSSVNGAYYKNDDEINFDNLNFQRFARFDWLEDSNSKFNIFITPEINKILSIIESNKETVLNFFDFSLGITPYDSYKGHSKELIKNKSFHSDKKLSNEYVPLISGKNIVPFYVKENIEEYLKYGDWLGAPRKKKFFINPRVIVRQIVSGNPLKIYAGYTEKPLYHTQIGFSIINKEDRYFSLKVLNALLNTKTLNFYHKYRYLDIEKNTFQKILIENCKSLPLPNISEFDTVLLEKLVDIILHINTTKTQLSTTIKNEHLIISFEEAINGCVFELYFKEHMVEKRINIIALVQQEIDKFFSDVDFNELDEQTKNKKIWKLYKGLKNSEAQQRMRLFVTKSPDILKPILQS